MPRALNDLGFGHVPSDPKSAAIGLEEYALALAYAHGTYLAASDPPRSIEELGREAATLRDVMVADATALATRGLLDRGRVNEIRGGAGYRDTAFDLVALVSLYRTRWSAIEGKTGISLAELEMAEILGDRLVTAVGLREQEPIKRGAAIEDRVRAFVLCLRAYNHARRAIGYLRFNEGDAESFAPSLYAGKTRQVQAGEEEAPATADRGATARSATDRGATDRGATDPVAGSDGARRLAWGSPAAIHSLNRGGT